MSYIHMCIYAYMCMYGYISVCTYMHSTARKLDFSYLVTVLKCQDLATCHVIGIQHIFMEFNFFYISNHYYCFSYLQNNYNNPLAFVIWAIMRASRASWQIIIWSCTQLSSSVDVSYLTNEWAHGSPHIHITMWFPHSQFFFPMQ